ncbi:hypothetical protein BH11PLA2_BH11PLA2_51530 [soil metagenome]
MKSSIRNIRAGVSACRRPAILLFAEPLEERTVPATFTVVNLNDSGTGSLRQALVGANSTPGADVVDFSITGSIALTSTSLPIITESVQIDGTTAPGFAGTPLVQFNFNNFGGLVFGQGSANSKLLSLGVINAAGAGVTLSSTDMLITGNTIGLLLDGVTVAGNSGDGIALTSTALRNTIGGTTAANRNLISGNAGHGISIDGGVNNLIIANFIGTDITGNLDRGNGGNGILLTHGAIANTIGGTTSAAVQFTGKAPDGNLISGNAANGILITIGSASNTVAANFIGTNLAGTADLGNSLDGVAITDGSNGNSLLGTFVNLQPFIFYNIMSGNDGNGLRIRDSNNSTIQANFFGLGSDNNTPVANTLNGVVIEGSSANTTMGGIIPLGNVVAANGKNGVVLQDTASGYISFNTFAGVAAFTQVTTLGNTLAGFLITSTGGNNILRTNVISENGTSGIELTGSARGVQIVQNIIGLNTGGTLPMGNKGNGIEISGDAHDNIIGGPQDTFSIIPINAIAANGGYGVAVLGTAHNNRIDFSHIGTNLTGTPTVDTPAVGNTKGGVLLGTGTTGTTIGSRDANFPTVISGNLGAGLELNGTSQNTILGTFIGVSRDGITALGNAGDGIAVTNSSDNAIGTGNVIAFNTGNGISLLSGSHNGIHQNSIYANTLTGIVEAPGTNSDQTAPFVTTATILPDGIRVTGTLTSTPNTNFTIEFFADTLGNPLGEGRSYLGSLPVRTDATGYVSYAFIASLPVAGSKFVTATATDPSNNTSVFSRSEALASYLLTIPGASINGGSLSLFTSTFTGESRAVVADFNGDGVPDLAAATGRGTVSLVRVLDGATGNELFSINPFGNFLGGLFITAGDINSDGKADLAITAGFFGGPRVRIFRGGDFTQLNDFFGIDDVNFRGGSNAAIGDINGDGFGDLIIAAGAGGGPRVAVYNGTTITNAQPTRLVQDFFAFDPSLHAGVFVAAGDINGDGKADLVLSPGAGGGPHVHIIDGAKLLDPNTIFTPAGMIVGADLINFFARNDSDRAGLRVAVTNLDSDNHSDVVTRSDGGSGHNAISFLGVALSTGTVQPHGHPEDAFNAYSNAIYVD